MKNYRKPQIIHRQAAAIFIFATVIFIANNIIAIMISNGMKLIYEDFKN